MQYLISTTLVLLTPLTTYAAVTIGEMAWPHTYFAIVLIGLIIVSVLFSRRTKRWQSRYMGKMGVVLLFLIPWYSFAAITINEVAWMGTENSANDEWIELYNDGSSISLEGWTLTDGANLSIPLSGTLAGGAYAVLERTDDTSAPGSAFLIYTGALRNTGATLTLKRGGGATEDQVAGGENWENIGGDNTTKETAQYTKSGWTTGAPTPGGENVTFEASSVDDDTKDADADDADEETDEGVTIVTSDSDSSSGKESVPLVLPDVTLALTLTAPTRAYVNQPVEFSLEASDVGSTIVDSLKYSWNFGDLSTDVGKDVKHRYAYPGTYVVVAHAEYKRQHATVRHEITVLPVTFSITRNEDGDLQIHNDARYEVDLSGYSLRGKETLVFPDNTILLPNATLTIPRERVRSEHAFLLDQEHLLVASTMPENDTVRIAAAENETEAVAPETTASFQAPPRTPREPAATPRNETFSFAGQKDTEPETGTQTDAEGISDTPQGETGATTTAAQSAIVNQADIPLDSEKLPYLGLIGVLSLGLLAVYAGNLKNR